MNDTYYSDEILSLIASLVDAIKEANNEAVKRGIEANTIIINERLAYMSGFPYLSKSNVGLDCILEVPPMIFGMEAYIAPEKDLPDGVGFEVFHSSNTAVDRIREEARRELLESMRDMPMREVMDMVYGVKNEDSD